ncbi:MAG: hypothetical protein IPJ02_18020 [Chitinophagaceae bacterium]|nr:hypothetical protein [Chitinophagaceae bacterium]
MEDKITVKLNYCINPMMAEHLHLGGEFSIREGQTREEAWEEAIGRIEAFFKNHYAGRFENGLPTVQAKDL